MASYVDPTIKDQFEALSINLKNDILSRNVRLNNVYDLIQILEKISKEGEK